MIERFTGEILATQDKLFPFDISADQITDWGLKDWLGSESLTEAIRRGERITLIESRLGRVAILICEDFARLEVLLSILSSHGTSHAMVPIFSSPIQSWHWEHRDAKAYADAAGTQVIVSNSLIVARQMPDPPERPGTALANTPEGHELGWSENAEQISQFRIAAGRAPDVIGRRL